MNLRTLLITLLILFTMGTLGVNAQMNNSNDSTSTTYYVDPNASNTNTGLQPSDAFETIQHALSIAQPGDTVHLVAGTFYQDFESVRSGTPSNPITIEGEIGTVVRGSGTDSRIAHIRHGYITLQNFAINGRVDAYSETSENGWRKKLLFIYSERANYTLEGIKITGMHFENAGEECVRLRYFVQGAEVSNSHFENCGTYNFMIDGGAKVGEALYLGTSSRQWYRNPIEEPDHTAYNWIHHNVFITRGNECVDMKEGTHDNIVENNLCMEQQDSSSGGIGLRGRGNIVRYNEITDNVGAGVRIGGHNENGIQYGTMNVVYQNVIRNNEGAGIRIQTEPQLALCANVISENGRNNTEGIYRDSYDPTSPCDPAVIQCMPTTTFDLLGSGKSILDFDDLDCSDTNNATMQPAITGLALMNTTDDTAIAPLWNDTVIDLAQTPQFTVVADVNDAVDSVSFYVDGTLMGTEGAAPYALAGDTEADLHDWNITPGTYAISVVPNDMPELAYNKTLTVVDTSAEVDLIPSDTQPEITGLTLMNAADDTAIAPLWNDTVIDLAQTPQFTVVASVNNAVENVSFYVDGTLMGTEGEAPYALAGDIEADLHDWNITPGTYAISVVPNDMPELAYNKTLIVVDNAMTNTPPVIGIQGDNPMTLSVGDTFVDPGALARDAEDLDITSQMTTSGTVDTNAPGTYMITYSVTDSAGTTTTETRTIIVQESATPIIQPEITGLTLMNAADDTAIAPLWNDTVIDLAQTPQFTVVANVNNAVNNVSFYVDGTLMGTEGEAPYALAGDTEADLHDWNITPGTYAISVVPNDMPELAYNKTLTVVDTSAEVDLTPSDTQPEITGLTLMNATNDTAIAPLWNDTVVDLAQTPQFTVVANVNNAVNNVSFYVDGTLMGTEGEAPYALAGDTEADLHDWNITPGTYAISVVPNDMPELAYNKTLIVVDNSAQTD